MIADAPKACKHGVTTPCELCFSEEKLRKLKIENATLRLAIAHARERMRSLEEALEWCKGAPVFAPGGPSSKGWAEICQPLLDNKTKPTEEYCDGD